MNPSLLDPQEGGKMEPLSGQGGSTMDHTTIDMKIQLVADASLPSYLIPKLTCDGGSTPIPNSKVSITLKGDSLRKETTAPADFKCEITSNFLTDKEKSAITIETYYIDNSSSPVGPPKVNTIYFDESLLLSYNSAGSLTRSDNPFLATATTPDNGATYTFEFDFDKIITYIKKLPSYAQIQNMFTFVNNIRGTNVVKTTLINISPNGFLNLKFSGVPFNNSDITTNSTLTLDINTTNGPVPDGCNVKLLFGSEILTGHLHKVLELSDYKDFDFSGIAAAKPPATPPPPPPLPVDPPVDPTAAARAAAEKKATEVKITAKPVIDKAVTDINTKMKLIKEEDKKKIPSVITTFINASQTLATAKAGADSTTISNAEAALKAASTASGLTQAIAAVLAPDSSFPDTVKDVLKEAQTIQDEYAKINAADAEVVKIAAVKDVNLVPTIKVGSTSSPSDEIIKLRTQLEATKKKIEELNKKLEQAQAAVSRQSVIVATNASECGKGGISMESKGGSFIFKVPHNMIISQIAPNMSAVIAKNVLASNAEEPENGNAVVVNAAQQPPFAPPPDPLGDAAPRVASSVAPSIAPSIAPLQNAPSSAAPPGATIEIDQSKKTELGTAKTTLSALQRQIIHKPISSTHSEVRSLETAVTAADTAVTNFDAAPTNKTDAAKKIAESLIDKATGLVAAAEKAVKDAIQKKEADEKAASDLAVKIGKLQDNLKTNAQNVLDAANQEFGQIPQTTPPVSPPGELENAKTAIEKVEAAIQAILNAPEGADKDALIQTATIAVDAAITAAKTADVAVKAAVAAAAGKPPTAPPSGADYATYEKAYQDYDAAKKEYESLIASTNELQAGGATPAEEITAAKETLKTAVEAITIPAGIVKLDEKAFGGLTDDATRQEAITKVTDATTTYTTIIQDIKAASTTYTNAKSRVIAAAKLKLDKLINYNEAVQQDLLNDQSKISGSGPQPKGNERIEIDERIRAFALTIKENELAIKTAQREYDAVKENDSQGGGSKQSKSSSSKSKSKSNSKNKTKKNHHSKSKSSKSKTPKIIMNE